MKIIRNIFLAIFVVAALAYLNVIIPQPQKTEATTYQESKGWLAQEYPCASGNTVVIHIGDEETPDCKNGTLSNLTSYQGGVNISLKNTNNWYRIHTSWGSYFCPELGGPCMQNKDLTQNTYVVKPGDYIHVYANPNKYAQNSCGDIQDDLAFVADVSYDQGKTWTTACGYGTNFNDPGQDATTATWCSTGVKCSSIKPTPTPTPAPTATPTPTPAYHDICQAFACVRVPGPGQNQCRAEEINSPDCSHLTCVNNSCERVPNPGTDTCSPEGSACGPIKHLACVNNACMWIPGPGAPQCTINPDSCRPQQHLACVNNTCQWAPGPGQAQCTISPDSCAQPHLKVIKIVNNNHGGTKVSSDFMLHVKNASGDVSGSPAAGSTTGTTYTLTAGDYTVSEDSVDGYHQVSISGDCDANGNVTLNSGDNKTCVIQNEDNGGGSCQMPSCNTNISGCSYPYPDTATCSCGPLVCITSTPNITVNVNQSQNQQQQQQQAVLAASVAPAVNATSLPSTGSGAEVLLTLVGLLPVGFKLRKLI